MNYPPDTKIFIPENVFYECQSCGKCCRYWPITMHEKKYNDLIKTDFYRELQEKYPEIKIIEFDPEMGTGSFAKIDGDCIMLENNRCLIHRELGEDAKSYCCRTFPFMFGIMPGEIYAGVSYHCPSIQENSGKPLESYLPLVRTLLETDLLYSESPERVRLTNDLSISWEVYHHIEKFIRTCIEKSGTPYGTWEAMSAIAAFDLIETVEEIYEPDNEEVVDFFRYPVAVVMKRTDDFIYYQFEYGANILSISEEQDEDRRKESARIILEGGTLNCTTFGGEIAIRPLMEYLKEDPIWLHPEFIRYMDNVLWRKQVLSFDSIFSGLTAIHFMPMVITWYAYLSASARGLEKPEVLDIRFAMGITDLYFNHMRELNNSFELFAEEITENIEHFFDAE